MKELNIIGHKNIFILVSGTLMGAAILAIILFGFKLGIDFQGGTLWQLKASGEAPVVGEVQKFFAEELKIEGAIVNFDSGTNVFLVRLPALGEADHQEYLFRLSEKIPGIEERSFQSIGPSIGARLKNRSLWAIVLVLVGISLYIAFAFRKVSKPISSWKYGVITLVTLFHDVLIPAGLLAVLGKTTGLEVDSNFVVALLVIMGFSVHDTIVVFDRIRENLSRGLGKANFAETINQSINQTMRRSINTSVTLILVLVALYFVGPENLAYFILTLLVGVTLGTYSSIFVASPALLLTSKRIGGRT